jgi:hypothetical protein
MATDEHELYFEVLPHHIRRRSTIKLLKHTALLARKIQDRSKLASLKLENGIVLSAISLRIKLFLLISFFGMAILCSSIL